MGVDGLPTMALKVRTVWLLWKTVTVRVDRRTVIFHVVEDGVVKRAAIQPVWLFGLPGRSTFSHVTPLLLVVWVSTGSTVCSPVIGLNWLTVPTGLEFHVGFEYASMLRFSAASCWLVWSAGGCDAALACVGAVVAVVMSVALIANIVMSFMVDVRNDVMIVLGGG